MTHIVIDVIVQPFCGKGIHPASDVVPMGVIAPKYLVELADDAL
jgi:hypothetical protein